VNIRFQARLYQLAIPDRAYSWRSWWHINQLSRQFPRGHCELLYGRQAFGKSYENVTLIHLRWHENWQSYVFNAMSCAKSTRTEYKEWDARQDDPPLCRSKKGTQLQWCRRYFHCTKHIRDHTYSIEVATTLLPLFFNLIYLNSNLHHSYFPCSWYPSFLSTGIFRTQILSMMSLFKLPPTKFPMTMTAFFEMPCSTSRNLV